MTTRPARRGSPASSGTNSGIWRRVGPATTDLRTQRGWWRSVTPLSRRTGDVATPARRWKALLQRATDEPQVRTVRVTISPDNLASYELASQYGFIEVGQQWDDEDGLEIVYKLAAGRP